ncbi:MAG: hypothetical protein MK188_10595 [Gammaproteobacteria bacterium]|nr:hypothetical protein [Gammaproteobacteria bacterium]
MKNKTIALIISFLFVFSFTSYAEKSIKHKVVEDIVTSEKAIQVFNETTAQLKTKTKLDQDELNDVHMITYSLEKAVAYFVENSSGDQRDDAEKMAELVELVHIASENNRKDETEANLVNYFSLASEFETELLP